MSKRLSVHFKDYFSCDHVTYSQGSELAELSAKSCPSILKEIKAFCFCLNRLSHKKIKLLCRGACLQLNKVIIRFRWLICSPNCSDGRRTETTSLSCCHLWKTSPNIRAHEEWLHLLIKQEWLIFQDTDNIYLLLHFIKSLYTCKKINNGLGVEDTSAL